MLETKVKNTKQALINAKSAYSSLCLTSSFQSQSIPLLHMVSLVIPEVPIIFLDTGFHFQETIQFKEELTEKFGLNVIDIVTKIGHDGFRYQYGNLYELDPDLCCHINKTEPLEAALGNYDAWISGVRADQTKHRATLKAINELDNGKVKICPILNWTKRDIWTYHSENNLSLHPLSLEGFLSIGCAPCTRRPKNDDDRSGRWADDCKTECGIHTNIGKTNGS